MFKTQGEETGGRRRLLVKVCGMTRQEDADACMELGADLHFCLQGGLALVEGIGERVTPLQPASGLRLLLVNPGFPVATPAVYKAYDQLGVAIHPDIDGLQAALANGDVEALYRSAGNALEAPACWLHPSLAELKLSLAAQGLRPLLSGSGGTFFAVLGADSPAGELLRFWQRRLAWAGLARTNT